MNFIAVFNRIETFQLEIIRNLFDMENIQYRIPDEFVNSAAGVAGLGINGMRVQILEDDIVRAKNILDQAEF